MENDQEEPKRDERESGDGTAPRLSDDRLYRALAEARRRRLLYVLLVEEETTVDEAATVLAGWDAVETDTMATPDDRERVMLGLVHVDLPVLSEAGLVNFDRESGVIEVEPLDDAVVDLICQSVETERPPRS